MNSDYVSTNAHPNITAALKRLNSVYPSISKNKSIDEYVEMRIITHITTRSLMFKIDQDLPAEIRSAIEETLRDQAKKLRMEVITQ
jgi:hypothetical protein